MTCLQLKKKIAPTKRQEYMTKSRMKKNILQKEQRHSRNYRWKTKKDGEKMWVI